MSRHSPSLLWTPRGRGARRAGTRPGVWVALWLTLVTSPAITATAAPALEPSRLGWSSLQMRATKFFMTADASLEWRIVPAAGEVLRTAEGALPPGPNILLVTTTASGGGRKARTEIRMDPVSGAALQRNHLDYQGRLRQRINRYAVDGAWQWTRWPQTKSEEALPPEQWTRTSEGLRAYPPRTAGAARPPILEPATLIYAVAAADLNRAGDQAEFTIFSRRHLQLVQARVASPRSLEVAYDERWPQGTVRRGATVEATRILLSGKPVSSDPDQDELEVLGLRGELELLLDPESRVPLQLTGDVKIVGRVTLRLVAMTPR